MNHEQKVATGIAALVAGSYLLYQAFEGSGRKRPFWARFLPGP